MAELPWRVMQDYTPDYAARIDEDGSLHDFLPNRPNHLASFAYRCDADLCAKWFNGNGNVCCFTVVGPVPAPPQVSMTELVTLATLLVQTYYNTAADELSPQQQQVAEVARRLQELATTKESPHGPE